MRLDPFPKGTVEAGGGVQRNGSSGSQRDRRERIHYQIHWTRALFLQYAQDMVGKDVHWYLMMADSYYTVNL